MKVSAAHKNTHVVNEGLPVVVVKEGGICLRIIAQKPSWANLIIDVTRHSLEVQTVKVPTLGRRGC